MDVIDRSPVTIVIYGPQGCGKSRHAEALLRQYGCEQLRDEWDGITPLAPGTLALTNSRPPFGAEADRIIEFADARKGMDAAWSPMDDDQKHLPNSR